MRTAVVATSAAAVVLSGCVYGGDEPPVVTVTAVPTASTAACERFSKALPRDLGRDLPRRDTDPDDPHVAAYGDPPVVIRCGAPPSTTYQGNEQLLDINGVDWFAEERGDVVAWSLPRNFTNVEVIVPNAWTGDRLAHLAKAVQAMTR